MVERLEAGLPPPLFRRLARRVSAWAARTPLRPFVVVAAPKVAHPVRVRIPARVAGDADKRVKIVGSGQVGRRLPKILVRLLVAALVGVSVFQVAQIRHRRVRLKLQRASFLPCLTVQKRGHTTHAANRHGVNLRCPYGLHKSLPEDYPLRQTFFIPYRPTNYGHTRPNGGSKKSAGCTGQVSSSPTAGGSG